MPLDLQSVELGTTASGASSLPPSLPMKGAFRTIRSYILWQHERGTLHYDIMVTLILIFIFVSPYWIKFNDKPVPRNLHPSEVIVTRDMQDGLVYEISSAVVTAGDDETMKAEMLRVIEPISGAVTITRYEGVPDHDGKVQSYRVWVKRK
ncbi:MAG TPA: hypothetical protein VGG14_17355 [Candidatus Sulfotelmatobacter sp.]